MKVNLSEAIQLLQRGDVVAIPTETVYGLAGDAKNEDALRKIYAVKSRPADNPLIVHIGQSRQINEWAVAFPDIAQQLTNAFWPGPLTIVLEAKPHVSKILTGGQATVAIRMPNHPLTLQLLQQSCLSLAAPSANKYTQLSPTTAEHVTIGLGDNIAVLDGGACHVGIESTIVNITKDSLNHWQWQLLRLGMISEAKITQVLGQAQSRFQPSTKAAPNVPGQHLLHYSPRTPLVPFNSITSLMNYADHLTNQHVSFAALLTQQVNLACPIITLVKDPQSYATHLYGALHELDTLGVSQLLLELPPDEIDWQAILDRLNRAVGLNHFSSN